MHHDLLPRYRSAITSAAEKCAEKKEAISDEIIGAATALAQVLYNHLPLLSQLLNDAVLTCDETF